MHSCCYGNIHYTYHLILSELFVPLVVLHVRSNLTIIRTCKILKIWTFLSFDYTKIAKMLEGPFCQIGAQI